MIKSTQTSTAVSADPLSSRVHLEPQAEDRCPYGALLDEDDPSWQSFHWSDAAATLHVSARLACCVPSKLQLVTLWRPYLRHTLCAEPLTISGL